MPGYYKLLEDGTTVPTDRMSTEYDPHIAQDKIGDVTVSTVFLQMDHNHFGEGPPILFETMIFGGEHDHEMQRYCTKQEALEGHAWWVEEVTPVQVPAPILTPSFGGRRKIKIT